MPRANRYIVSGAAYHLTHRCHDRAFLLKFARHRDRYREILREADPRRGLFAKSRLENSAQEAEKTPFHA